MNFREALVRSGNENRIMEMHNEKLGPHTIAGIFKDNGINISAAAIIGIIAGHKPLCAKPLPKAAVKRAINASKNLSKLCSIQA